MSETYGMRNGRKHPDNTGRDCSKPCMWLDGGYCRLMKTDLPECIPVKAPRYSKPRGKMEGYSEDELEILRTAATARGAALVLGRPYAGVAAKRSRLMVHDGPPNKNWQPWELVLISPRNTVAYVAECTGRTERAVKNKAWEIDADLSDFKRIRDANG